MRRNPTNVYCNIGRFWWNFKHCLWCVWHWRISVRKRSCHTKEWSGWTIICSNVMWDSLPVINAWERLVDVVVNVDWKQSYPIHSFPTWNTVRVKRFVSEAYALIMKSGPKNNQQRTLGTCWPTNCESNDTSIPRYKNEQFRSENCSGITWNESSSYLRQIWARRLSIFWRCNTW